MLVRKTDKFKLKPTPAQEQAMETVLWRCRELYNAALAERREAYRMRGVSVNYFQQKRQLKDIRAELPEYAALHPARCAGSLRPCFPSVLSPGKGRRHPRLSPI